MQRDMKRPCARRRWFNMVEVALATAIVGIGFVSILALFPVGLNTSRDAMSESYAAEIGDQFINIEDAYSHYPSGWLVIPTKAQLDIIMPSIPGVVISDCITDPKDGTALTATSTDRWYRIQRFTDTNGNGALDTDESIDCDMVVHVAFSNGSPMIPNPSGGGPIALPSGTSALLKVEVRWPVTRTDTARQGVFFAKQIFRPS